MLPTNIEEFTANHISSLVLEKVSERRTLEYKERLPEGSDGAKKEFLADVCSFANALGGDLFFGIRDQRDANGRATGTPDSIVGLQVGNLQAECTRLDNIIRDGISPRVPAVHFIPIDVNGAPVVVLRIGRSWIKPHMVTYGGTSRFYSKNSNGKYQLDVQEIGQLFGEQRSFGDRLQNWRVERISKALSDEGPVLLTGPSKLLVHFVPASALVGQAALRGWQIPQPWKAQIKPSSLSSTFSWRYNADGFLSHSVNFDGTCASYVQVFRNGCLEYGDGYILNAGSGVGRPQSIPSKVFEQKIAEIFENAIHVMGLNNTEDPIHFAATLVGVKGMRLSRDSFLDAGIAHTFDREVISTPELEIVDRREQRPYAKSVLPIVNSVWQANGYEQSPFLVGWNPFTY